MDLMDIELLSQEIQQVEQNIMVKIDGQTFRCDNSQTEYHGDRNDKCGGNVFSRIGNRYKCNACGEIYIGE